MQNTSFFQSSDSIIKTRTVNIFGKEIKLKNYICSPDGIHYKEKPRDIRLQLTICPTAFCDASCPFCLATDTDKKGFLNIKKLEDCLKKLHSRKLIRGISFSGGEPFEDVGLLNEIINLIFDIFGKSFEISVTTNGKNLHRMHEIEMLSYLDALHISRHHYDEKINERLFGIKVPSNEELSEILHSVSYRDLFVLNCMLLKDYIGTTEKAHRFLDFAIAMGAGKVSFINCTQVNEFTKEQFTDFRDILKKEDPSLLFTRGFTDFGFCQCQDGVYVNSEGAIIEFYGRSTNASGCDYCRGFVYTADNHLRQGFGGEIIF